MQTRLQNAIALTAVVYATWMSFGLWWRYEPNLLEVLANVLIGLLLGTMFVYLSSPTMRLQELFIQIAMGAGIFVLVGAFAARGINPAYLMAQATHGFGFGIIMWALNYVYIGIHSEIDWHKAAATIVCAVGLFLAPFLSEMLFNGAIFLVVAVAARIFGAVTLTRLPLNQQGFVFGAVVGISAVALPVIGYFAYGAY